MENGNLHWLLPKSRHDSYDDYCESRGGQSLAAVCAGLEPEDILESVQASGLRGRGGAGFPTGTKWASIARNPCPQRTVVCNAAEGEPGTYKDRFLLEASPYATLEGMILAARVVGAKALYFAIKASFADPVARVESAVEDMRSKGAFEGLEFHLVPGPEEYLFGEEKALLNVIDGNGPFPREAHYPPYEWGVGASLESPNPSLVNNVETFAHVATIVRHGPDGFRSLGTPDTPGTILCTVSGDVLRPGVYEVEAGTSLRELLHKHAGGPREGRTLRAVFSGVASRVIPEKRFGTPCDFGSLRMIGAGLGSAGFIVVDDATSIPRVVQSLARFLYVESCGQCPACKSGLETASKSLDEFFAGDGGSGAQLRQAKQGAERSPQGNRCFLPVQGSQLIPSVLDTYAGDFEQSQAATPYYTVPKIVDFDQATHTFTYDESQMRKRGNWEYDPPPSEDAGPTPRPKALAQEPQPTALQVAIGEDIAKLFEYAGADELAQKISDFIRKRFDDSTD